MMDMTRLSRQFIEFYDKLSSWEHSVVKGSGLSPAQMHTIEVIGYHQNLKMKELAERLGITTGTLTVAVDRLENLGMVERRPHERDRRSWLVVLTERGREMFEQHSRYHEAFTQEIANDLTVDETDILSGLMSRVLHRM
jgi:DNA-binding MarR family transcriptional regulator